MGKYKVMMMALLAVFAVSAVAVSSASAAHQWLNLKMEAITKVEPATTDGTIVLKNKKIQALFGGGEIQVTCMGQFLGTVGPSGTDSITLFESLTATEKDELGCTVSASTNSICKSGTAVVVKPVKLPWATQLVLATGSSTIFDDIKENGGTGNIGYTVVCNSISDECTNKLELSTFLKNISTGAEFDFKETEKASCTIGEGFLSATGGVVLGFLVN